MAKFARFPKLSRQKTQEMIIDLCEAIAATRNSREAADLLTDILGKQELEMVAKRLRVAELLLDNYKYDDIIEELKVSPTTIARVQVWLQDSGDGYRMIIERTKSKRRSRERNEEPVKLSAIKKKYPGYFWPQIMLEYWIKNSSKKQKQEMQAILAKVDKKTSAYKELKNLLQNNQK
jgi:TrpR-related protein YerC/YecD